MRVAYVEDNSTNLALVERVASMSHHVIVSYTEGEIALRELMREKVDLILMDVELAGELSGLQVVRGLRAQGLKTPIIAVTAYAMMGDREKCIEAGCTDYLPNPLPITELVALLNRYDEMVKQKVPEAVGAPAMASAAPAPAPTPTPVNTPAAPTMPVPTAPASTTLPPVPTPSTPIPAPVVSTPPSSAPATAATPTPPTPIVAPAVPAATAEPVKPDAEVKPDSNATPSAPDKANKEAAPSAPAAEKPEAKDPSK